LIDVYVEALRLLAKAEVEWVQLDEPIFALDLTEPERSHLRQTYASLTEAVPELKLIVSTYFNDLGENLPAFAQLPVHGLHIDAGRSEKELEELMSRLDSTKILSLGLVHGRDIWRNDYERSLSILRQAVSQRGEEAVWIAPSCSLLHVPFSLKFERKLDPEIKSWLAFAEEKLVELSELRQAYEGQSDVIAKNRELHQERLRSGRIHSQGLKRVRPWSKAISIGKARTRPVEGATSTCSCLVANHDHRPSPNGRGAGGAGAVSQGQNH
jgi:5-methyltetrahydropteroyltriglutamate--homocysteine methyltransferase